MKIRYTAHAESFLSGNFMFRAMTSMNIDTLQREQRDINMDPNPPQIVHSIISFDFTIRNQTTEYIHIQESSNPEHLLYL
jgi:hypothetical protein